MRWGTQMKNDRHIQEEVEKTLQAIDGMQNLESNPFLFARLKAELAKRPTEVHTSFTFRSALLPAALVVILLINLATAVSFLESPTTPDVRDSLITALRDDYQIVLKQDDFMTGE